MEDAYGHRINYLRISVTDRCNERCGYCLPEEQQEWADRKELLTDEEILRTLEAALALGLRKVRVTGGEPLLRPGIVSLLGQMRALPGLEELAVSSNGTWLARPIKRGEDTTFAEGLWKAGVRSLNLSLDTLDQEAYAKTTGRDLLPAFREGLHAAKSAGFERIRLNCVLARGRNEHELWDLTEFAHEQGCLLRFIELMPVSTREVLDEENFLSAPEAKRLLEFRYGELVSEPAFRTNGPAVYYRLPDREQRVGFISAMSNLHFCENCNKLRLTADGKLRPCLGSHLEFDLREVLRDPGMSVEDVQAVFREVVARKPKEHDFRDNYQPGRRMIAIGG